jgi:hypothetical protein
MSADDWAFVAIIGIVLAAVLAFDLWVKRRE